MAEGLIGALIAIGIVCIVVWAIFAIIAHIGAPIPAVVHTVVWAVVGIICLLLLARGIGVAVPGL